jgi:Ca2+-binding EF-hand superfamily protein
MAAYDTNMDGQINLGDSVDDEHLSIALDSCDYNDDGNLDACEIHDCIVEVENTWRAEYCPENYPKLYCTSPFDCPVCEGAWSCADIEMISEEVITAMDVNNDGQLNLGDGIEPEHYDIMIEYCDTNGDGTLCYDEVFDCIVACENEWRAEYCPGYGMAYCANPYEPCVCEGAWTCDDIIAISYEVLDYYSTNGNMYIDSEDEIATEHFSILVDYCDSDDDGNIDLCEIHDCVEKVENEWRDEYCPNYGHAYCANPFEPCAHCEGEWNCSDVTMITEEAFDELDTNNDGQLNLGDNIDSEHLDLILGECD